MLECAPYGCSVAVGYDVMNFFFKDTSMEKTIGASFE